MSVRPEMRANCISGRMRIRLADFDGTMVLQSDGGRDDALPAFLADGKGDELISVAPEVPGRTGSTEFRPRHLAMRQLVVENTTQSSLRVIFHYSSQRMSKWASSFVSPSDELIDEIIAANGYKFNQFCTGSAGANMAPRHLARRHNRIIR